MGNSIIHLLTLLLLLCNGRSAFLSEELELGYEPNDLASDENLSLAFERWTGVHEKTYDASDHKHSRFRTFKENLRYIYTHNHKNTTYSLALNEFADLTFDEFRSRYLGYHLPYSTLQTEDTLSFSYENVDENELPKFVDWRKKGAVTPAKSQACADCWAFAAVAAVEGINQIVTKKLVNISVQEVSDCDTNSSGCSGGTAASALEFIASSGGVDTDEDYPYQGSGGVCHKNKIKSHAVTIDGYQNVPTNDEKSLLKAVAHQPVSVAVEANGRDFTFYKSGVFTGQCGTNLDHGMTVVGYGSMGEGSSVEDYWILKNSWGPKWGENGFIRIKRNIDSPYGLCGIAMNPVYPTKSLGDPNPRSMAPPSPSPGPSPSANPDCFEWTAK